MPAKSEGFTVVEFETEEELKDFVITAQTFYGELYNSETLTEETGEIIITVE